MTRTALATLVILCTLAVVAAQPSKPAFEVTSVTQLPWASPAMLRRQ